MKTLFPDCRYVRVVFMPGGDHEATSLFTPVGHRSKRVAHGTLCQSRKVLGFRTYRMYGARQMPQVAR